MNDVVKYEYKKYKDLTIEERLGLGGSGWEPDDLIIVTEDIDFKTRSRS